MSEDFVVSEWGVEYWAGEVILLGVVCLKECGGVSVDLIRLVFIEGGLGVVPPMVAQGITELFPS